MIDALPDLEVAQERVAWRKSRDRRGALILAVVVISISQILSFAFFYMNRPSGNVSSAFGIWTNNFFNAYESGPASLLWSFVGITIALRIYKQRLSHFRDTRLLSNAHHRLEQAEEGLRTASEGASESDFFQLWNVNQKRLDYYHEIATAQARQSFRNAQYAMIVGFAVIVVAAVAIVRAQNSTGAAIAGALGAVGAGLAAYVGRTFVKAQEESANHLRSYFAQPLELSRYLIAERLLDKASIDSRDAAAKEVALAILLPHHSTTAGAASEDV